VTLSRRHKWLCSTILILASSLSASGQSPSSNPTGFIALQPEDLTWTDRGEARQVVIAGDPAKPGLYVIRLTFPPGYRNRPHSHSQDRYVTVIKGTWWVALGSASYDPGGMVPMKAGSFVMHPAGGLHYDGAGDEEVVVQIIGMGPVTTEQLRP
jgi:quercetin dioxygenase-like cupin family protein